jgi:hypothetical protein
MKSPTLQDLIDRGTPIQPAELAARLPDALFEEFGDATDEDKMSTRLLWAIREGLGGRPPQTGEELGSVTIAMGMVLAGITGSIIAGEANPGGLAGGSLLASIVKHGVVDVFERNMPLVLQVCQEHMKERAAAAAAEDYDHGEDILQRLARARPHAGRPWPEGDPGPGKGRRPPARNPGPEEGGSE